MTRAPLPTSTSTHPLRLAFTSIHRRRLLQLLLVLLPALLLRPTIATTATAVGRSNIGALGPLHRRLLWGHHPASRPTFLAAWCSPAAPRVPPRPYSTTARMGSPAAAAAGRRPDGGSSSPTALNIRKGREDGEAAPPKDPALAGQPKERKKRRVAMVMGYVGTNYCGLQKSEGQPAEGGGPAVETIESTVERALFEAGYVKESNFGDLDKIGWARCSRTDKGVHAARNVVSAKIELPQTELEESCWSPLAVAEINAKLPPDIRLFSVAKVTKNFRPRDAVSFREYQYLLPVRLLRPFDESGQELAGAPSDEEIMARFCALLAKYQGTHNFHNFTKIKSRDLIRRLKAKAGAARNVWQFNNPRGPEAEGDGAAAGAAAKGEEDAEAGDDDEEGQEEQNGWEAPRIQGLGTAKVDGVRRFNTGVALNPLFEILRASPQGQKALNEKGPDRKGAAVEHVPIGDPADGVTTALWDLTRYQGVLKMVRTNIYVCEGRALQPAGAAEPFVAVTFQGSSFLYNQIRLLIGGAVAVVNGLLPEEALAMALDSPYLLYSPLAPAEGLYLRHITFGRRTKNPVVMHEHELPPGQAQQETGAAKVYALLSREAAAAAEAFEEERILAEVIGAWTPELVERWRSYAEAYRVGEEVAAGMAGKFAQWRASMRQLEEAKAGRELFRRERMASWAMGAAGGAEGGQGGQGGEREEVEREIYRSYRKWMPQRFATDVIIRFRLKPGKQIGNLQRGLAVGMTEGAVPPAADTETLFGLIEDKGVAHWEAMGQELAARVEGRGQGGDVSEGEEEQEAAAEEEGGKAP